mmetsp:Transcript_94518/g.206898  ORF Transcript_94518/g.206898 Transcript_94518/m.206898 type:complete len:212 (+) Transcript_94518:1140-1775(+)
MLESSSLSVPSCGCACSDEFVMPSLPSFVGTIFAAAVAAAAADGFSQLLFLFLLSSWLSFCVLASPLPASFTWSLSCSLLSLPLLLLLLACSSGLEGSFATCSSDLLALSSSFWAAALASPSASAEAVDVAVFVAVNAAAAALFDPVAGAAVLVAAVVLVLTDPISEGATWLRKSGPPTPFGSLSSSLSAMSSGIKHTPSGSQVVQGTPRS